MKAKILHESRGRIRLAIDKKKLTLEEADILEEWFRRFRFIQEITVHERTCNMIIHYATDSRSALIQAIREFKWEEAKNAITITSTTSREINREYQEKLVHKVMMKVISTLFFPAPLRTARMACHMVPFMHRGLNCIRKRQMKVDLLDSISIGVSAARGDFGTAGSVMFLLEIGELLEEWTRKKSIDDLAKCMSLNVDRVWLRDEEQGEDVLVPISQIEPGNRIVVRVGSVIPLDGVIDEGVVTVNQASLTGESVPVGKQKGSSVYAGTVIEEGECVVKVTKGAGESRYDRIVTMIEESQSLKSEVESKAGNLADKLVPYTFLGSVLGFIFTGGNTAKALSVLMVDFSCALKLAMPLAVLSAMREAGREHITVKGGRYLEAVAAADTVVFDKTGTLTFACPVVEEVIPFNGNDENEMLRLAACLEEHFPHSLANAVVEEAKVRGLTHDEFHTKVEYLVAHGISSTVNGKPCHIGSAHFIFEDLKCAVVDEDKEKFENLPPQYSHLYLAVDDILVAVICISDPLREEAADVLKTLHKLGIKNTIMLTGDSDRTAKAIAAEVGVDQYRSEMLPSQKAEFIADLRAEGHTVIMVGDGINDSPALSESDAGIAISDGAALAREIADITISANTLWELVKLRSLSTSLMERIHSNYRFVIGFNGSLIALGLLGVITPAASATFHNLSTLALGLHSMGNLPERELKELPEYDLMPEII